MHELGLCASILHAVEQRAGGRPVQRVAVRCGILHRVDEASMRQSFQVVAEGSVADRAEFDLEIVPAVLRCHDCGLRAEVTTAAGTCPGCGSAAVSAAGGDELILVSLTYGGP
jgi:hydrogenase nickel incorporation protein HypA/HybF